MKILITGGAGFVGHHFVEHILKTTDHEIVSLDRLSTSGNLNRLTQLDGWDKHKTRVKLVHHDLRSEVNGPVTAISGKVDAIFHLAASSHVDRSISDPMSFVLDNVVGTCNILNFARKMEVQKFLYFSTDEVFGPAPNAVLYKEWDRYNSGNPYSASKAGGEELCLAYHNTYGLPVMITHCMNIIGERQHAEKYIPSTIRKVVNGDTVQVHASPDLKRAGSRFYIHARNVADAAMFILENGLAGQKYNIVGEREIDNLTLARMIASAVEKPLYYEMVDAHSSRPGHDLRYALDGEKLRALGWKEPVTLDDALAKVVRWTLANPEWI